MMAYLKKSKAKVTIGRMAISIVIPRNSLSKVVSQNGRYFCVEELGLCLKIVPGAMGISKYPWLQKTYRCTF